MDQIWDKLKEIGFKVSTDTRKDVSGTVFFALKGENFDGTAFAEQAREKGAVMVVTDNALETLQKLARRYRDTFHFPIIAIGGSNGKTTTRELTKKVLETKYKTFSTEGNFNNHIGVPLSIFAIDPLSEVAVFEIGANHIGEHTKLLEILNPTHVLVTNNGMDHLEGFGSPEGVVKANKEIVDWALSHGAKILEREEHQITVLSPLPLTLSHQNQTYVTKLIGAYNLENINWALTVGKTFGIATNEAMDAVTNYEPKLKRSQLITRDTTRFVVDCYNANPSSMQLSLKSFLSSTQSPRGVILGDMLELGDYAFDEHGKIIKLLQESNLDNITLIGPLFKKVADETTLQHHWFPDWQSAQTWFKTQNWDHYTLLLKGSRGIQVEKVIEE